MSFRISHLFSSLIILMLSQTALAEFADIQRIYRQVPNLNQFEICQSGGCAKVTLLALNDADWQPIGAIFSQHAQSAEMERDQISKAIGLLEAVVGHKAGTSEDRAGTFDNSDYAGQQDCNDEAINTTTYMRLLKQAGYMVFHEIEDMRTRNFFFTGWPHTTAVIREIKTGERFAVDSWFYDNGHPATIVPFNRWKANYQPEDSPIGKPRKD
jgi:hypothetical protein